MCTRLLTHHGSFPPPSSAEELGILEGTGIFDGAVGEVSRSGSVNLENAAAGEAIFNLIFVVDVETASGIANIKLCKL